jgi:peptide/nickel transport system substrate-binding protein
MYTAYPIPRSPRNCWLRSAVIGFMLLLVLIERLAAETTQSFQLQEAPVLQALVKSGQLPPVSQRLPEHPAVVQPLFQQGKYGGTWRLLGASVSDLQLNMRMGYEPLVRWDPTGREVVPGVAESWEMRDEGRTFIFHLRKGMKWSDGVPLTADDFVWTSNEVLRHRELPLIALTWMKSGNELPTVEAPDEWTVVFRFGTPYGAFPRALAFQGVQHDLFLPRHYVEKHHSKYVSKAQLDEMVHKAGFRHWSDYFLWVIDADKNVDLPVIGAFKIKVPYPAERCTAERNPYYYKVDPTGKQLPYIDELAFSMVFDTTVLNLKAMNGETDFQLRRIDPANFTMFREQGHSKGFQVRVTPSTNCTCVYINQYSRDEQVRPILQDRRFRLALAHAINREELVELIFSGLAEPSGGFTSPQDTYYIAGLELANASYDPGRSWAFQPTA